jgi:chromosomal replication initiator protein
LVIDHIIEIPLPGRTVASHRDVASGQSAGVVLPSFVAGPENRLVAATFCRFLKQAELEPAATPRVIRTDLIPKVLAVFGPSGTGKTHLARGLVRHWQTVCGNDTAGYLTAQDFRRQFNEAMETRDVVDFRHRMRSHELLVIDDLHHLPDDDYLAQELRYTVDAMEEAGNTMVVTASRPAATLPNMPPDLRARFASGLTLQLAPPGTAARLRIVRLVTAALNRPLSDDVLQRLAAGLRGTVSQLVGALFELCAELPPGGPVNVAHANRLLTARAARRPSLQDILAVVAKYYKLPQKHLKGKSRKQSAVFARATVAFLARELTDHSYEQIGHALGGRDHTTVMHNYQKIERELQHDPATQEAIEDLRRIFINR